MIPHRYLTFHYKNKYHAGFDLLSSIQSTKCYSNGIGVCVLDVSSLLIRRDNKTTRKTVCPVCDNDD